MTLLYFLKHIGSSITIFLNERNNSRSSILFVKDILILFLMLIQKKVLNIIPITFIFIFFLQIAFKFINQQKKKKHNIY